MQDSLAHIRRELYPANFAALQREIHRRLDEPPIASVSSNDHDSTAPSSDGCQSALVGWGCGVVAGVVAGHIWFLVWAARLKASGINPYGHDDWGFGWMGCIFISVVLCSLVGLFMGMVRSKRRS